MNIKEAIIKEGQRMRWFLWGIFVFTILCLLGIPSIFGLDILPMRENLWLMSAYTVLDILPLLPHPADLDALSNEISITAFEFSLAQKLLLIGLFVISTFLLLGIFWQVNQLFRQYSLGHVFTTQCVQHFKKIGRFMLVLFLVNALGENFVSPLFMETSAYLPIAAEEGLEALIGPQYLSVAFIDLDFSLLLAGLFTIMVARVMELGVLLQTDADSTI